MVRQAVFEQYGDGSLHPGPDGAHDAGRLGPADAAYQALRRGVLDLERRQAYRGRRDFIELPADPKARADAHRRGDLARSPRQRRTAHGRGAGGRTAQGGGAAAATTSRSRSRATACSRCQSGLAGQGARPAAAAPGRGGARGQEAPGQGWADRPSARGRGSLRRAGSAAAARSARWSAASTSSKNKFNHVTQAWRQPGSSFKPFMYSAALEKGVTPATVVNDAPLFFGAGDTGSQPWEPKNYDGQFDGPMTHPPRRWPSRRTWCRSACCKAVGRQLRAASGSPRFGFDADKHPPYLTMALGAGSVTPLPDGGAAMACSPTAGLLPTPRFISAHRRPPGPRRCRKPSRQRWQRCRR